MDVPNVSRNEYTLVCFPIILKLQADIIALG